MKATSFPLLSLVLALLVFSTVSPALATVVTFDDIPLNNGSGTFLPNNYQNLVWSNFFIVNGILSTHNFLPTNGLYYGVVSPSNVVGNAFGDPAEIDAAGANFNFLSAYFTGAWNSNLNVEAQGFRDGTLIYDQTVVAGATNSTLFTFNFQNIDRLTLNSFGGQLAFPLGSAANQFAMDNFTFELIPEPSSLLLTATAALLLWPLFKRKRVT